MLYASIFRSANQLAHLRSLISAFIVHYLNSSTPILARAKISRHFLDYVAEQASLSLSWSQNPEDKASRDMAQVLFFYAQVAI